MPFDPHDKFERRDSGDDADRGGNLGSLAQSARSKQLKNARAIMFVVAVLLGLALIFEWVVFENELKKVGALADREKVDQAYGIMYIATGIYVGLIVMYIIFGLLVDKYPTPITITGLVVYIALNLVAAALAPETIVQGIIVKVIVIVCLSKAIKAAIAYENERKRAERQRRSTFDDEEDDRGDARSRRDEDDDDRRDSRRRRDEHDDYHSDSLRRHDEDDDDDRRDSRRRRSSHGDDRDRS
jgi:hypothetical protein